MPAPVVTAVTIANSALLKIGADKISSLSGTSRAAQVVNSLYSYLRDEVMGSSRWRFAKTRVTLAPNSTTPPFGYDFSYDLPSDCLLPLGPDDSTIKWVVEGSQILSDEPTLDFHYIYRNTDESSWDARFAEAFAWRIAQELCLSLARSASMYQVCEKGYQQSLSQARSMNSIIGSPIKLEADTWSNARKGINVFRKTDGQTT